MPKGTLVNKMFMFIVCAVSSTTIAQGQEEWVARYNGEGNYEDWARAIAVDETGNVYVTGGSLGSTDSAMEAMEYATIKYNSDGDTVWVRSYNAPEQVNSNDEANAMVVDGTGNVYVTGYSWSDTTNLDYATIKYNSAGMEQWVARYNTPGYFGNDWARAIAVDGSGNVYVTGESWSDTTSLDYATIKYNSAGMEQWVARYTGPGNGADRATAIAVDEAGNVYVTGEICDSSGTYDYATIKYNSDGDTVWVRRYNGPVNSDDKATAMAVDEAGNVYVTGGSLGSGWAPDYATIKYDSAGDTVWVRRYDAVGLQDYAYAIAVGGSGNVYVTGGSIGTGSNADYTTIKYNSDGDTVWVRRYPKLSGESSSTAYAIALDGSGNVYVTGTSNADTTYYDYATVKYNSAGMEQWVGRYSGPGLYYDEATAIAVDGSGNVYVTGNSYDPVANYDYVTIKYSAVGVEENQKSQFPTPNPKLEVLPSPLTALTEIKYELPKSAYAKGTFSVKIELYNLAGRKVATVAEGEQSAGMHVCRLKGDEVSGSGIYFIKFSAGNYKTTKKLILLK